jgi:hypothetical protein
MIVSGCVVSEAELDDERERHQLLDRDWFDEKYYY